MSGHEYAARARKVLGMVAVIDANVIRQGKCPYDQAGRILLASASWTGALWLSIAQTYKKTSTAPSELTKQGVRDVYRGRAMADLSQARAS